MFLDVQRKPGETSPAEELLLAFARRFREQQWPCARLPEVFYDPRSLSLDAAKRSSMHAKCVVIDRQLAFVSSANFTEAAQERNIEVGVLIRSESFAAALADQFEVLATQGILMPLSVGS
jgi:phosphatidylserine/phosphatidylglycerophosphate/cardiolipin synthase-like enzyme